MKILLQTITHENQRYETVGDWRMEDGVLVISCSELPDRRFESLVLVHELVEAILCQARGVSEASVDEFDMSFIGEDEPGDDPNAPYRKEHFHATTVERLLAEQLGVDWNVYERAIENLFKEKLYGNET